MVITRILRRRIEDNITSNPLGPDEFRHIRSMGDFYISLRSTWNETQPWGSVKIAGQDVHVYYLPEK